MAVRRAWIVTLLWTWMNHAQGGDVFPRLRLWRSRADRAGRRNEFPPAGARLNNLARELVLFLCETPRVSERGPRHARHSRTHELLADAKAESFSLPDLAATGRASLRLSDCASE